MAQPTPLAGMQVAVSRRPFPQLKRAEVVALLTDLGARVVNEVTRATDFVLCDQKALDDASTPKIRTALARNIPILLPADFDRLKAGEALSRLGYRDHGKAPPPGSKASAAQPTPPPAPAATTPVGDRLLDMAPAPQAGPYAASF